MEKSYFIINPQITNEIIIQLSILAIKTIQNQYKIRVLHHPFSSYHNPSSTEIKLVNYPSPDQDLESYHHAGKFTTTSSLHHHHLLAVEVNHNTVASQR